MNVESIVEAWDWYVAGVGFAAGVMVCWFLGVVIGWRKDVRLQRQIAELRRLADQSERQ